MLVPHSKLIHAIHYVSRLKNMIISINTKHLTDPATAHHNLSQSGSKSNFVKLVKGICRNITSYLMTKQGIICSRRRQKSMLVPILFSTAVDFLAQKI